MILKITLLIVDTLIRDHQCDEDYLLFIIKIIMLTLGTSGEDYIDMDYSETCIILKFSYVLVLLTNSALIVTYVYTIYDICMQLKGLEWNGK